MKPASGISGWWSGGPHHSRRLRNAPPGSRNAPVTGCSPDDVRPEIEAESLRHTKYGLESWVSILPSEPFLSAPPQHHTPEQKGAPSLVLDKSLHKNGPVELAAARLAVARPVRV